MILGFAKKHGIKIIEVEEGDVHCKANGLDVYLNASYICGKEIYLGIYQDEELRLLSFFHEMGHAIDDTDWSTGADKTTTYKAEKKAWELGYKLAERNGVSFSDNAKQWANEQLEKYNHFN